MNREEYQKYKKQMEIPVDSKALKEYLLRKKELEEKHFPKVKMVFDYQFV